MNTENQINDLYHRQVPRYTSYPTALEFRNQELTKALRVAVEQSCSALSLYVHIPFCKSLCYYCGCNKVITQQNAKADDYLHALAIEIQQTLHGLSRQHATHLHLGGGSPSFLTLKQHQFLIEKLQQHIDFASDCQLSIELDPRSCSIEYIKGLASLGYRRISFGVQDTNITVQKAINRIQSSEHIGQLIDAAYAAGFKNINADLIVGLPEQNMSTINQTLTEVLAWDINRITVFNYAHLPERFAAQRKYSETQLPSAELRKLMTTTIQQTLTTAKYQNIGMDHYAKFDDPLVNAMEQGTLQRNFQGYTADNNINILGFGASSISTIGNVIAQNPIKVADYKRAVATNSLYNKGKLLSQDDMLRQSVINHLMCNYNVDLNLICARFDEDPEEYFLEELETLWQFVTLDLITIEQNIIKIKTQHRPLVRVIASVFDVYYMPQRGFSKVI